MVSQDVSWNVDARQTTGQGSLKWAASEPVSSIEFQLPATIIEVRAPDLSSWAQTDGRVQVWFRKPMKDGRLDWLGTLPGTQPGPFEPPIPSLANAKVASLLVRVRPEEGWGVRVERDKGWTAVLTNDRVWTFQSDGSQAPPRLQLFAPTGGRSRGFGSIEIAGSEAVYRTTFEADLTANRPHHIVLQARGLPKGIDATLDVPPGTLVHEGEGDEGSREWDLDVPASAGAGFRCSLVMKFPAKGSYKLPVLDLRTGGTIPSAHGIVRWIGLTGGKRETRLEGVVLASPADVALLQAQWPGEAERLRRAGGTTWSAPTGTATLQFEIAPAPPSKPPVVTPKPESVEVASASPAAPETRIFAALAWCGTAFGVLMLFARAPRFTWPEQVGLLGGLFGFAVAGGWAVGIGVYAAARLAWLVGLVFSRR